jgi:hypothetical protein
LKILHRADGNTVPMEISLEALPEHRAHGDLVPGVDSGVPYAMLNGKGRALAD